MTEYNRFSWEVQRLLLPTVLRVKSRIAENMSTYPDPSDLILLMPTAQTPLDCIAEIWALEYVSPVDGRYQCWESRQRMARLVRNHRREGQWTVVEELLQQPPGTYYVEAVLLSRFSTDDIFGNLLPRTRRRLASMRPDSRQRLERQRQRRRTKEKVRRRGYAEHVTLRPGITRLGPEYYARPELPPEPEVTTWNPKPHEWISRRQKITRGDWRELQLLSAPPDKKN